MLPRPPAGSARSLRAIDVLFVCTGNICRSPMAEVLLAAQLRDRGVVARVHSAGTLAWGGAATAHAVDVLAARGLDLGEHRSRQLRHELVEDADLVLGMTRDHVGAAVARVPHAAARTFLLGELVRLGRMAGPRGVDEPVRAWAARVARLRPGEGPPGRAADEVPDPLNDGLAAFRRTAVRLERLTVALADLLAGRPARA